MGLTEKQDQPPSLWSGSPRLERVQSPVIPVVADLIRRSPGTISLGQGVVYYGPPDAAMASMRIGLGESDVHKYKPVTGLPALLDRLGEKLRLENGIHCGPSQAVVVTAGGNQAFYNALLAVTDAGDEVILQTPYYFNHEMAIVMANARPVLVPTDADYHLQPNRIRDRITPRTRAVVTVSPNNPTGAVYREEELRAVNELCKARGIYHIHDEAYEYFTWDRARHVSPGGFDGAGEHTISLYSLSKAYGFASWRIGYMAFPGALLEAVRKIQDTLLICAPVVSQLAAVGALGEGKRYCLERSRSIVENRRALLAALQPLKNRCDWNLAEGAFYVMLRLPCRLSSMRVVERLVQEARVAVIPGNAFGIEGECSLRVAYGALQPAEASEAFDRLVQGIDRILGSNEAN